MEQHLGEEYDALIISVQKFGFFVELMEIFVEGLVPMNRLEEEAGEHCFFRERDHAIVAGRGNRASIWKLGRACACAPSASILCAGESSSRWPRERVVIQRGTPVLSALSVRIITK